VAMAAKLLAQREELETELRGARLRRSLKALLLRTPELRGSTPPLPHSDQPRGHPAWLPELSKATTLYVALVDALFVAHEWQAGAGVSTSTSRLPSSSRRRVPLPAARARPRPWRPDEPPESQEPECPPAAREPQL